MRPYVSVPIKLLPSIKAAAHAMTDSEYYSGLDTGAEEETLQAERQEKTYALIAKTLNEALL